MISVYAQENMRYSIQSAIMKSPIFKNGYIIEVSLSDGIIDYLNKLPMKNGGRNIAPGTIKPCVKPL